jgi:hypothetical protein
MFPTYVRDVPDGSGKKMDGAEDFKLICVVTQT